MILSSTESNFIHQNLQLAKSVECLSVTPKIYLVPWTRITVQYHTNTILYVLPSLTAHWWITIMAFLLLTSDNWISSADRLNLALPSTPPCYCQHKERGAMDARQEKNICSTFYFALSWRPFLPPWCHPQLFPLQYSRPLPCLPLLINLHSVPFVKVILCRSL